MINNARGNNVSPGVFMTEVDIPYAVKSLGITNLGVVGETLKGPAFEPIKISDWAEFQDYFGGTSTEKFKESAYPKYELPYIAKSYLEQSKQLEVCRILGLSGYNAGPAYMIYQTLTSGENRVVCVLRSRGEYKKVSGSGDPCKPDTQYDSLEFDMMDNYTLALSPYKVATQIINNCGKGETDEAEQVINDFNYGRYNLTITSHDGKNVSVYPISFNPADKDYIINVLGMKQEDGESLLYVEELYDVALEQNVLKGLVKSYGIRPVIENQVKSSFKKVSDIVEVSSESLKASSVGKRLLADKKAESFFVLGYKYYEVDVNSLSDKDKKSAEENKLNELPKTGLTDKSTKFVTCDEKYYMLGIGVNEDKMTAGRIYTVVQRTDLKGKRFMAYDFSNDSINTADNSDETPETIKFDEYVYVDSYDRYFKFVNGDIEASKGSMTNYKEQFRSAMTPWFVSELKGLGDKLEVKKLFRMHTISDGNAANGMIKVSIANINPDEGTFDVLIRDFNDTDASMIVLERFSKCTMMPGTPNYLGLKIGTYDGEYEIKSKYVTVEIIENDATSVSVPCGFLGYPVRTYGNYAGIELTAPQLEYNLEYNENVKETKQFFGMSNIKGVDIDVLNYKGVDAYRIEQNTANGYTNGFHLDSYVNIKVGGKVPTVFVDGKSGYAFDCVNAEAGNDGMAAPRIGSAYEMENTIYEDIRMRKFTAYPYGGFDGWDIYRGSRTNSDEFKFNKYKGVKENNFAVLNNASSFGLPARSFGSDYYAYLAAYKQFANPEKIDINILATPGIDYVNNLSLVKEVFDLVEVERQGDCLYVVTTPDKPFGMTDFVSDMYTPEEAVDNLLDSEISSSYGATYYPWIKYYDKSNKKYIMLPPTKDVMKDFAYTDNKSYPWIATAGVQRGNVDCEKAHFHTKIADENVLYENMINPIKTFAVDGVTIMGNKTMYFEDTPLNRINVRRLMIRVKKLVSTACRSLIFGPNDQTTVDQFYSIVNPILSNIQKNRGIKEFKVIVEDSVEARDQHTLPAKIMIKPIGALEYIDLTFVITPEGANFDE